jgi:hypothetical protein
MRVILSVLGNWPGPSAWRRLHRSTRQRVLDLADEGELHPDPEIAAIAVEWARWRARLSPLRQLGFAILTLLAGYAALGLVFLLLTLLPGSETTHDGSPWGWVHLAGLVALAIWRLVMVPASAAHDILRMHALAAEQSAAEVTLSRPPDTPSGTTARGDRPLMRRRRSPLAVPADHREVGPLDLPRLQP